MNDTLFTSLPMLVSVWIASAGAAALIFMGLVAYWRKERRLPLATAFEDLEQRHADLRAQRDDALHIISEADQARQDKEIAQSQLIQLKDELLRLEPDRQDLLRVRAELTQAEQARSEIIQVVQQLRDQEGLLKTSALSLGQQKADLTAAIDGLTREKDRLSHEHGEIAQRLQVAAADLKRTETDLSRSRQDQDALVPIVQRLREQEGQLKISVASTSQQLAELKTTHETVRKEYERLSAENVKLAQQFQLLTANLNNGSKELARLEEQLPALRKEKAECEALVGQRNALKQEISALEASLDRMRQDRDHRLGGSPAERYRDLWQPLDFAHLAPAKHVITEQSAIQRVAGLLTAKGLVFPERTLHAYHTALKTAEQAPITILAGISGTGKSALPRAYAAGMGIHFVQLAVQPRWDSPQDLFGFFNHIEGRYKATELARALVQFEIYNRSPKPPIKGWPLPKDWDNGRQDRMCLVLLDEMNLARVEYYFSEFLSKLETRRGIDPSSKEQRRDAEITIDMGSLSENETPISFYPDLNVLYTGTMNEDETTQSLSDKVVDRACVLRFGRPGNLDPHAPSRKRNPEQEKALTTTDGLTFAAWKGWVQKSGLNESDHKRVMEWIESLNQEMDELHRPFAHRTALSILAYVGNYPSWVPNRIELAMADQIEQRILPRLRGINPDECEPQLTKLGGLIQKTGDKVLADAFDIARKTDRGTFIWFGVDRSDHA
jgi:hypothetical protein